MKRLFILVLLAAGLALLIQQGLKLDTGYVRIVYNRWLIETNVWVMAASLVGLALGLFAISSLIAYFGSGTGNIFHWFRTRPLRKANQDSEKGLLSFLEGNWDEAYKLLTRSANKARTPLVNLLAAANAASRIGDHKESARLLKQAHALEGGSELAASLTQARLLVESERYEAAIAVLQRLNKAHPKHRFVLQLMTLSYRALGDWEALIKCIGVQRDAGFVDKALSWDHERSAWAKLFSDVRTAAENKGEDQQALSNKFSELWKRVPNKLCFDEKIIYSYTRELLKLNRHVEVEIILRKALDKSWSENLIDAYGHTQGQDATEQLLHAERWLKERPNSPRLLLCLGRLSLKASLWGKAYDYFSASQKQQSSADAAAELCRLAQSLNKPESEIRALTQGLMKELKLPDLPQPK